MFDLYFTFPLAEKSLYEQFDFAHTAVFLLFGNIANIFVCLFFPGYLREVAKKVIFLVAMATKALLVLELSCNTIFPGLFFRASKKVIFS